MKRERKNRIEGSIDIAFCGILFPDEGQEELIRFSSAQKAAWKIGGGLSLCAFRVYGTINSPKEYTGPFATIGGTIYHIKGYFSSSFDGKVRCYGIGISSSKFGFSPLSVTGYLMVPPQIILSLAGLFASMVGRVKRIAQMA